MIHVGDDADFDVSMPSSVGVRAISSIEKAIQILQMLEN